MKITNHHNLPDEIVNAFLKDRYTDETEDPFDYSASTLVAPIQLTVLKKRHPHKLVVRDVVDFFWRFMGSIAHNVLEEAWHESMGSKVEKRLYLEVAGKVLAGKIDCYGDGQLRDYKTCKAYKIVKGKYDEWEQQLNIYAQLLIENGYLLSILKIYALIFDWKETETGKKNYPDAPVAIIPFRLWADRERADFIYQRIMLLEKAFGLTDEQLAEQIPCSRREMWQDLKDIAIIKKGSKRATKTFEAFEEAEAYMKTYAANPKSCINYKDYEIVERWTARKRCLKHCDAATVCKQHERLLQEEGATPGGKREDVIC
jgi:hypothetical protein